MNIKSTLLAVLAIAVSSGAIAANLNNNAQHMGRAAQAPTFAQFDGNSDQKITPQEFSQAHAKRISERAEQGRMMRNVSKAVSFETLDVNKDGVLTGDEFAAHQHQMWTDNQRGQQRGKGMRANI
ncbi:EF hand [Vibrio xiamenensis]|uniref:EF hand n=1 Tax=Vibrio xiamenensis TaxID=861298 RepID=A0A1G7ZDE0_9VIBR|nr:EF-hand domain-containing protein [Vibrio xiamenensis]SDH06704.1 EF hand [Vibrio xiamenensis]